DLTTVGVQRGKIVTVLSAELFSATIDGDRNSIATIFGTGFDNADSNDNNPDKCRRLHQDKFVDGIPVSLQINGPIMSIYFSDFKGALIDSKNKITTSLQFFYDNLELKSSGFVTSQGYIGCKLGQVYRSSFYAKSVKYSLFTQDSHFVHQVVYIDSPVSFLNVTTDLQTTQFRGESLLKMDPQRACDETHKLIVDFDQTMDNSFCLMYDYSNTNCDDVVVSPSKAPASTTTTKGQLTNAPGLTTTGPKLDTTTSSSPELAITSVLLLSAFVAR
ncbi:hypothetical protein PFISCL1PPCAC_18957, partial [Pristionchus fissidentatus]